MKGLRTVAGPRTERKDQMTVKAPERSHPEEAPPAGDPRAALVAAAVVRALGTPAGLLKVQARPLWGDRYRVNVYSGESNASASLVGSYFILAGTNGEVIDSDPPIKQSA